MIHFAFPNEKESDNFSWICDSMQLDVNLLLFRCIHRNHFILLDNPPDEGFIPYAHIPHFRDGVRRFSL